MDVSQTIAELRAAGGDTTNVEVKSVAGGLPAKPCRVTATGGSNALVHLDLDRWSAGLAIEVVCAATVSSSRILVVCTASRSTGSAATP